MNYLYGKTPRLPNINTIIVGSMVGIIIVIIVIIYLLYPSSAYTTEADTEYYGNHILSKPTHVGYRSVLIYANKPDGCKVGIYDNNKECWLQSGLDNKETHVGYISIYV